MRSCLRNRSLLAVKLWVLIYCLAVSYKGDQITNAKRELFIFLRLTDNQWIYYSTILANKKWRKIRWYPSDSYNLLPLHRRNPAKGLTGIRGYFLRSQCAKTTLHLLLSRRHGRWEGWRHKTAAISVAWFHPVNCCRIEQDFSPLTIYEGQSKSPLTF